MFTKSISIAFLILCSLGFSQSKTKPKIQIALLLDASGSMDGLINQAQSKLWALVNEMAVAKKSGQTPQLEVALFMYGHSSLAASEGYVRCLQGLTSDLDTVSESLFKISTNGGEEYCGAVIKAATGLNWSPDTNDYKAIFIAGNEPFTQGPTKYQKACKAAIAKGIVVNTIFCGEEQEGIQTHWKDGADMADGRFMCLQHNQAVAVVNAPQDAEIMQLGKALNETFLAYGTAGRAAKTRQREQDLKSEIVSADAAVARTIAKASPAYKPSSWDLVTAAEEGEVEVAEIAEESLPEALKGKDDAEKKAVIDAMSKKREAIKQKLDALKAEREAYIAQNQPKGTYIDDLMFAAIREQMASRHFEFPKKD